MPARAGVVGLVLVALMAVACGGARERATATAVPIDSVASIAGTWAGTLDFGAGEQPCTLVIDPSGRATLQGRTLTQTGSVTVQGGKGTYSFPGRSDGSITLYQESGRRELQLKGVSGVLDVWVRPR